MSSVDVAFQYALGIQSICCYHSNDSWSDGLFLVFIYSTEIVAENIRQQGPVDRLHFSIILAYYLEIFQFHCQNNHYNFTKGYLACSFIKHPYDYA